MALLYNPDEVFLRDKMNALQIIYLVEKHPHVVYRNITTYVEVEEITVPKRVVNPIFISLVTLDDKEPSIRDRITLYKTKDGLLDHLKDFILPFQVHPDHFNISIYIVGLRHIGPYLNNPIY